MCGIVGMCGKEMALNLAERKQLTRPMYAVIAHRGPDDEGAYVSAQVALGMQRLAIIDLRAGNQPLSQTSMRADTLNDERTRERRYFNQPGVPSLFGKHLCGRRDNALQLWGLLVFELWQRAFIDRRPEPSFTGAKEIAIEQLAMSASGGAF